MNDTSTLGHLLWFRVAGTELKYDDVEKALARDGLMPDRPAPIDVFRRITGTAGGSRYTLGNNYDLEITCQPAKAPNEKTLVRDVVATVTDQKGVAQVIRKVGEAVFVKPPRGQAHKARLKLSISAPLEDWVEPAKVFEAGLRRRYKDGTAGTLDPQAIRRIVRGCLAEAGALYLDGPYFVLDTDRLAPLRGLFAILGEDCFLHAVPLLDAEGNRELIARGIERAVANNVEVDENIWKRLEEGTP